MATFAKRYYRRGPRPTEAEKFAHSFEGAVSRRRVGIAPEEMPLDVLTAHALAWLELHAPESLRKARLYYGSNSFMPPIGDAVDAYFAAVKAGNGNTSPDPL